MDEFGPGEMPDLFSDFLPRILNSFSSRSAFFIIFIEREGFTNPFFRFLDSPDRSAEVSQSNS
jgi:hypothetical protein